MSVAQNKSASEYEKEEWPEKFDVWLSRVTEYCPLASEMKPEATTARPAEKWRSNYELII